MNKHKFKPVYKDRLFYDQYTYCMNFYLDEVSCLRKLDHASIDDVMEHRRQWREIAQQRWVNGRQTGGAILRRNWREITEKTVSDLHGLAEQLLTTKSDYKLVVGADQGHIYTNDLTLIDQLSDRPELSHKSYTQAQVIRPKNTIVLNHPRHKFRSYFKVLKLTDQQKDHLMDFLYTQRDHVRVSPALQIWIDSSFNRTQDYFFVDYETDSWPTMLNLVLPGIVRKTMHIIPAK